MESEKGRVTGRGPFYVREGDRPRGGTGERFAPPFSFCRAKKKTAAPGEKKKALPETSTRSSIAGALDLHCLSVGFTAVLALLLKAGAAYIPRLAGRYAEGSALRAVEDAGPYGCVNDGFAGCRVPLRRGRPLDAPHDTARVRWLLSVGDDAHIGPHPCLSSIVPRPRGVHPKGGRARPPMLVVFKGVFPKRGEIEIPTLWRVFGYFLHEEKVPRRRHLHVPPQGGAVRLTIRTGQPNSPG